MNKERFPLMKAKSKLDCEKHFNFKNQLSYKEQTKTALNNKKKIINHLINFSFYKSQTTEVNMGT